MTADLLDLVPSSERTHLLNTAPLPADSGCVVYWMQNSQRLTDNPALATANAIAADLHLPTLIWFGFSEDIPNVADRSACFLIDGLAMLFETALESGYGIRTDWASTDEQIATTLRALNAAVVVTDVSHLRFGRARRRAVADRLDVPLIAVDGDVVVPVHLIPGPQNSARVFRPKLWRLSERFVDEAFDTVPAVRWPDASVNPLGDVEHRQEIVRRMSAVSVPALAQPMPSGEVEAKQRLNQFLDHHLTGYSVGRREPADDDTSRLSCHLRYGQISPRQIVRQVRATEAPEGDRSAFLDEVIIRRELSANYVYYEPAYDDFTGLPSWAQDTLTAHRDDPRPGGYNEEQMERGATDDPLYNAAMLELRYAGTIHNFARMYWGKQILAWHPDPRRARRFAQELNDRYGIDGRSANGFANVAWCFGLHDHPWPERAVFGKVRSMTLASSGRKIDLQRYATRIESMRD